MNTEQARARLVTELVAAGSLGDDWRIAFEQVPRHLFIPDTVYQLDRERRGNNLVPLHRADQPNEWLELAYADAPIDTQVDDGHPDNGEGIGREVTSSSSQPAVVAEMLSALEAQPGMRVLEIGAGTGWNAALLAWRLGAENVVTVEIDQAVAWQARTALDAAGFGKVTVVTGDGLAGYPDAAPYDRVIATVGVRAVPHSWVAQTAPGGRLVAPLRNSFHPPGLAVLTVHEDGTASGGLGDPYTFMSVRSERVARASPASIVGKPEATGETELHPTLWANRRDAAMAIGQRVGDAVRAQWQGTSSTPDLGTMWLLEPDGRSWAAVKVGPEPPYKVWQGGPRRLFDEVADAYQWWCEAGEPPAADWTVTVGPEGQALSLPSEDSRSGCPTEQ